MKSLIIILFASLVLIVPMMIEAQEQIVFEDDFSDNSNDWSDSDTEECTFQIQNGSYIFHHKREEGAWLTWQEMGIDQTRDFHIQATITKVSGVDNYGYGLVWGLEDVNSYYQFVISGNGYYRYAKEEQEEWTDIIEWTTAEAVQQGDNATNILSIRKQGEMYTLSVNDQNIAEVAFEPFFGENVGFVVYRNMKLAIDHLVVTQPAVEELQVEVSPTPQPTIEQPRVEQPPTKEEKPPISVTQTRVALVIGNSAYGETPLPTPLNDADNIAQVLKGLGFYVLKRTNAAKSEMESVLADFERLIPNKEVALVYFSGYGAQVQGGNFIIPVGADIRTEGHIPYEAIALEDILRILQEEGGNRANVVILDACREFEGVWLFNKGLAAIQAPARTLISYAAAPGVLASGKSGGNSLYTQYLLDVISRGGLSLIQIFETAAGDVAQETEGKQTPWFSSALPWDVYLSR